MLVYICCTFLSQWISTEYVGSTYMFSTVLATCWNGQQCVWRIRSHKANKRYEDLLTRFDDAYFPKSRISVAPFVCSVFFLFTIRVTISAYIYIITIRVKEPNHEDLCPTFQTQSLSFTLPYMSHTWHYISVTDMVICKVVVSTESLRSSTRSLTQSRASHR